MRRLTFAAEKGYLNAEAKKAGSPPAFS